MSGATAPLPLGAHGFEVSDGSPVDRPPLADRIAAMPPSLLLAPIVVLLGVAIVAWDYATLPPDPVDHVVYWLGLAVAYAGIAAFATVRFPGAVRQIVALAALGAVMWLPTFLRSPARPVFVDELYHRDVVARMLETGHATGLPVTLYPLPGTFPGLEHAAVALIGWTGLDTDAAIRLVALLIHATIPAVAYLAARGLGIGHRGSFLAALVYAANTSFFFFHAVFSYETLGILLFLSTWAVLALHARPVGRERGSWRDPDAGRTVRRNADRRVVLLVLPLVAGIAVTHHVSSYLLVLTLAVTWVVLRLTRSRAARPVGITAILAAVFAAGWFLVSLDRVGPYLGTSIAARVQTVVDTLFGAKSAPRALFANPDQPQLERILAFSYPPLVLVLAALGLWVAWRVRPRSPLWVPFALIGPLAWIVTTPAVFTRSGELAYRAWPFLFLGVGVFTALGLLEVARRAGAWRPSLGRILALATVGVLLFGGISIGENQAGRFPLPPKTAAGGATNTDDVVAAAVWLRATAGPDHLVATDVGTAVPFATDGRQRILGWASWYPFLVGDPGEVATFVRESEIDYLVVDRRITTLPPRYGSYYGAPPVPPELDPGIPVPATTLATLDQVPSLQRVYAGPNIVIYRVDADAPVPGAG